MKERRRNAGVELDSDGRSARREENFRRAARLIIKTSALLFIAWCLFAWCAARWLIVSDVAEGSTSINRIELIVVLAGAIAYEERCAQAAEIWHERPMARIVLTNDGVRSGWVSAQQRNPLFIERARQALERAGVPRQKIEELPQTVAGTYQEAVLLRDFTAARGVRSIIVVTSPYHTRRARWILRRVFEGSGVEVAVAAASPDATTPRPATWFLSGRGWRDVAGEYAKFLFYALNH